MYCFNGNAVHTVIGCDFGRSLCLEILLKSSNPTHNVSFYPTIFKILIFHSKEKKIILCSPTDFHYVFWRSVNPHLSCRCLVASARCSSSMMQVGGNSGCMLPRCGEPVGVDIRPLSVSLGRVKFLGRVAGAGRVWCVGCEPAWRGKRPFTVTFWEKVLVPETQEITSNLFS